MRIWTPRSVMLIRLAALVAVEAPPVSYAANLALAGETGIAVEEVQALLIAVAPIVGTRVSLRLWETSPAGWGSTSSRWTEPSPPSS